MSLIHNNKLTVKISLLVILIISVLALLGCVRGLQPIGWSGVAIADGNLFTGSKEGRLVAINADGSRRWSEPLKLPRSATGFGCAPSYGGGGGGASCSGGASVGVAIYGTPVVADGLVYIGGYNGKVYAFNSNTLELRWIYPREDYLKPVISGLNVTSNTVYFGTDDGKVFALDAATGDKEWEFQTGGKIWSTPTVDGDILFVGSFDNKLYALDTADGSIKWEYETGGAIASTPLVYENTVYTGSFDRNLYAINISNGSKKWEFSADNWFWAKPIVYNGIIYAGCLDGKVYTLDVNNGDKLNEYDLGSPVASSPIMMRDMVIFAAEDGRIYRIDTGSKQLKQLAAIDSKAQVSSPIAATDEVIYIHTPDLTIHPIYIEGGSKLMTISLKYGS
ncbi:PQQ-binding-like beta-propeller repeat protein [Chloroflexota bacterium]